MRNDSMHDHREARTASARRHASLLAVLAAATAGALLVRGPRDAQAVGDRERTGAPQPAHRDDAPARFVGSDACASCHAAEHAAWQSSHHRHAMEPANDRTVLGNFDDADFVLLRPHDALLEGRRALRVTTENERGQPESFTVSYTLGIEPLQQYLVTFSDGRLQALPFAWDSRPADAGGQRWFHLYPGRGRDAGQPAVLDPPAAKLESHVRRVPHDRLRQGLLERRTALG